MRSLIYATSSSLLLLAAWFVASVALSQAPALAADTDAADAADAAPAAAPAAAATPADMQEGVITGTVNIDFKTRTNLDNSGKLMEGSAAKGAQDKYSMNLRVAKTTE